VYPALAVLKALQKREQSNEPDRLLGTEPDLAVSKPEIHPESLLEILWIGGEGGMEADLVSREGIPFATIPAAGVHGVGWRSLPGNLWQLWLGFWRARRILHDFIPQAMFFTGGYLAVPVALAGKLAIRKTQRYQSLLFVPDIEPGLALKVVARLADQIALTTEVSMSYFQYHIQLTVSGYPTRSELLSWNKESACAALGLISERPTLLVMGGSKGARSINRGLLAILPELLVDMQILHISGHLDWGEVERAKATLPKELAQYYHPYPYLHAEMGAAMAASDLVVSRSGASTLGEYPLFGLPAILVPYPYAWRYQEVNARYLEQHGAAIVLTDEKIADQLLPAIRSIISNQSQRKSMMQAMQALAQPQSAQTIADMLYRMASISEQGRN
jgi:UDP-N-acetylglucosamine--N-acetylmuramyl-(pentapeptide) pyrophosphoryl-undecaprenol N-acetylglucosamine transferase